MPLPMSIIACHYALKYKKPFVIESGADGFTSIWHHGGSIKYKLLAGIKEQIESDCLVHVNYVDSLADTIKRIKSSPEYSCICSYENYYRAFKYNGNFTDFYNEFYKGLLKA